MSGVTTLRDIGSKNEIAFPIRDAVRRGVIPGPRLILTGTPITTTAGHCWMFGTEADTVDEVVTAVRRQKKLGADCIKMMATGGMFTPTANPRTVQYPAATLRAAVVEAERLDMQIVAHTLSADGVRNCVEAGIHHLVHARWLSSNPQKGLDYDREVSSRIAANGQAVDVTFGLHLLGPRGGRGGRAAAQAPLVGGGRARLDGRARRGHPGHAGARRALHQRARHGHGARAVRRVVRERARLREVVRLHRLGRRWRPRPSSRPRPCGSATRPAPSGRDSSPT